MEIHVSPIQPRIIYPNGTWGLSVLLMRRGSVLPKAFLGNGKKKL